MKAARVGFFVTPSRENLMPKPLAPNERLEILELIHGYVDGRLCAARAGCPVSDRHAKLTDDQRQFVADCVQAVIAEIDYVLSPVPDEDEIETTVEKT